MNKVETFIWKGEKIKDADNRYQQVETRLVDMSEKELQKCYDHCKVMLFNSDTSNPGRYVVLNQINDQKNRCGVELFLRYLETEKELKRFNLITRLNEFLENNRAALKDSKITSSNIFSNLPSEYDNLPLNLIMDGCIDKLGAFSKKHITRAFVLRQGVWLTSQEMQDLEEEGKDKLEVIRERLDLKEVEKLYINSKGLNYTQLRGMFTLKNNEKYTRLSTNQLETLRYRMLFVLEEDVKKHIEAWEKRMLEIDEAAQFLGYKLA